MEKIKKSSSKDSLGDRMKEYEDVTRFKLPRKSYILARIDGNAFHTYTKGLKRPFDEALVSDMDQTAIYLCKKIQNVKFAYVQSDEISLLLHEEGQDTQPWFANNLQKMASIAASKATSIFNQLRVLRNVEFQRDELLSKTKEELVDYIKFIAGPRSQLAEFDARFWTLPSAIEVYNYFLWRQRDAEKNSISAAAQALYSHKELEGVNGLQKQELMFQKGVNWNDYDPGLKRGRFIERVIYFNDIRGKFIDINDGTGKEYYQLDEWVKKTWVAPITENVKIRSNWEVVPSPIFSQDIPFLMDRIQATETIAEKS